MVNEFIYVGERVSAGGGCDATATARARCGRVKFKECGNLLYKVPSKAESGCLLELCIACNPLWKIWQLT